MRGITRIVMIMASLIIGASGGITWVIREFRVVRRRLRLVILRARLRNLGGCRGWNSIMGVILRLFRGWHLTIRSRWRVGRLSFRRRWQWLIMVVRLLSRPIKRRLRCLIRRRLRCLLKRRRLLRLPKQLLLQLLKQLLLRLLKQLLLQLLLRRRLLQPPMQLLHQRLPTR